MTEASSQLIDSSDPEINTATKKGRLEAPRNDEEKEINTNNDYLQEEVIEYLTQNYPSIKATGCFLYIDAEGLLAAADDEFNVEMFSIKYFNNDDEMF